MSEERASVPITAQQVAYLQRFQVEIKMLQRELTAAIMGILTGHGITDVQDVKLEGGTLTFVDTTSQSFSESLR